MGKRAIKEAVRLGFTILSGVIVLNAVMEMTFLQCPNTSKKLMVGEELNLEWKFDTSKLQQKKWNASLFIYNFTTKSKVKFVRLNQNGDVVRSPRISPYVFQRLKYNLSIYGFARIHLPVTNFQDTAGYGVFWETSEDSITSATKVSIVDMLLNEKESSTIVKAWAGQRVQLVCSVTLKPTAENPLFEWSRDVKNETIANGVGISRTKSVLTLIPKEKYDFGEFFCRARTLNTKVKHNVTVIEIDYPGKPTEVKVTNSGQKLSWKAPIYNQNGSPVTFHIQVLNDETTCAWVDVNKTTNLWISTESLLTVLSGNVPELCTFRVCAIYAGGVQQNNSCSELTSIKTKMLSAPTVFVSRETNRRTKLTWEKKASDDIPHQGYIIQVVEKSLYWNNAVIRSIYVNQKRNKGEYFLQQDDLVENILLRVCIRNSFCVYEKSCSDKIALYPEYPRRVIPISRSDENPGTESLTIFEESGESRNGSEKLLLNFEFVIVIFMYYYLF